MLFHNTLKCNDRKNPQSPPSFWFGAVHAMMRAGYFDVKGKLYPGMRHEILNEKEKEKVWSNIVTYIKKKGF